MAINETVLAEHDVSDLVGLNVIVRDAAIEKVDDHGETIIEVPNIEILEATAAVARCLLEIRLRGHEMRAIRKIAGWTAADLAAKLGEKTSPETVSRWENEKQPIGGYAEKVLRLVVCEELKERAIGVSYSDGMIARLVVIDPWKGEPEFVVPHLVATLVKMRSDEHIVNAWTPMLKAA